MDNLLNFATPLDLKTLDQAVKQVYEGTPQQVSTESDNPRDARGALSARSTHAARRPDD